MADLNIGTISRRIEALERKRGVEDLPAVVESFVSALESDEFLLWADDLPDIGPVGSLEELPHPRRDHVLIWDTGDPVASLREVRRKLAAAAEVLSDRLDLLQRPIDHRAIAWDAALSRLLTGDPDAISDLERSAWRPSPAAAGTAPWPVRQQEPKVKRRRQMKLDELMVPEAAAVARDAVVEMQKRKLAAISGKGRVVLRYTGPKKGRLTLVLKPTSRVVHYSAMQRNIPMLEVEAANLLRSGLVVNFEVVE